MESEIVTLPASRSPQTFVTISALEGGQLTLPESLFVTDADPSSRKTVPSLSFLIQHPSWSNTFNPEKLVFDLGLKRDFSGYRDAQQQHIAQRQPTSVSPDVLESLQKGGLPPDHIDTVVLSHVHWDHVGTSADFPKSEFIVGSGTMHLLANGSGHLYPAELFNPEELPKDRTRELPSLREEDKRRAFHRQTKHKWIDIPGLASAIDFFDDGSLYVVDAPGHLPGHVNILARIGPKRWAYLGGDCCHDPRILSGDKGIAMYDDGRGGARSVHADTEAAAKTVKNIARLLKQNTVEQEGGGDVEIEIIVAHDAGWMNKNRDKFWPGQL